MGGTQVKVKLLPEFKAQDYPFIILSEGCTSPRAAFGWFSPLAAGHHLGTVLQAGLSSLSPLSGVGVLPVPLTESSHCLTLCPPLVIGIYSNDILLYGSILLPASDASDSPRSCCLHGG